MAGARVPRMIQRMRDENLGMVIGTREETHELAYRPAHRFGNQFFSSMVSRLFGRRVGDLLSGYRVLSRRFVKSFLLLAAPIFVTYFETGLVPCVPTAVLSTGMMLLAFILAGTELVLEGGGAHAARNLSSRPSVDTRRRSAGTMSRIAALIRWPAEQPSKFGSLLFLFALTLRLIYFAEWSDSPFFRTLIGDGLRYHQWALEIAGGDWFGREVFFQAPLYPYLLGVLYSLFGDGLWVPRLAQAMFGSLSCVLMWRFGHRAFTPAVGLVSGIALALYPPSIFNDGILQKTSLTGLLLAASLYLYSLLAYAPEARRRNGVAVLLGAVLALLALAQEHLLLLTPLMLVFLALRRSDEYAKRLLMVVGVVVGLAIVFVPIGLRNQSIGGTFLITTSQLGANFYLGNNPGADGHYHAFREGRGDAEFERIDAADLAQRVMGRRLTPSEVSSYWLGQSLDFMRKQPLVWLALSAKKWHLVWHERELPDTDSLLAYADQSTVLQSLFAVWNFGILVPFALAGIALRWREGRSDAWLRLAILGVSVGVAAFIIYGRYRYGLALLLLPFAGTAFVSACSTLRRLWSRSGPLLAVVDGKVVATAVCAFVAGAVLTHWPLPERDMRAINYYSVAVRILDWQGSLADAEEILRRTIAIAPNEGYPYFALSVVYKRQGDFVREVAMLRRALTLAPGVEAGYAALADAERRAAERQGLAPIRAQ